MSMDPVAGLAAARDRAMEVRALYEQLERHLNRDVWTHHELLLGLVNDVGTVGRLTLARDGTWNADGDINSQLEHKLSEVLWWVMVIAERLDIDIATAFAATMNEIEGGLAAAVQRIPAGEAAAD